jgi:predicted dehydrogenase
MSDTSNGKIGRREFLGTATAASFMILKPELVWGTAANSAVRLGLLGCGGRGTAVTTSFIENAGARVVALGDLFADKLAPARKKIDEVQAAKGYAALDSSQLFHGPKACEQLLASKEVDAVYIATPPYYHVEHLEAAVAAKKHVYVEKPAGIDVPGAKRIIKAGEQVKGQFSLAVGFQIRCATPYVELVRRIHAGALGKIVSGLAYYYCPQIQMPDWPAGASPAEQRIRHWLYYRNLSGDIIVEQNVHVIDVCNWILQEHPVKAVGAGGRVGRTDEGDCYSHFNVVFTYPADVHVSFGSTQFGKAGWDAAVCMYGPRGGSESHYDHRVFIKGEEPWDAGLGPAQQVSQGSAAAGQFKGALDDADAMKEKAFITSITSGNFLNEAATGAESALSGMLGRTAAYTGREVTWDELLRSKEVLDPKIDLSKLA